jgi:hypothetical protein
MNTGRFEENMWVEEAESNRKIEENLWGVSSFVLFDKFYYDDDVKEEEVGAACSMCREMHK